MRALLLALVSLVPLACAAERQHVEEGPFTGRVVLRGTLAHAEEGSVRVDVRGDGDGVWPLFSRRYALGDPAFERHGAELVLRFELDARHRVKEAAHDSAATAVEASFEPRGLFAEALGGEVAERSDIATGGGQVELVLDSRVTLYDGDMPDPADER